MPSPDAVYRARVTQYEAVADAADERSRWHSRARLVVVTIAVAALVVLVRSPLASSAALLGFSVIVFAWLVVRHDRIERRRDAALAMVSLNRHALARRARSWHDLPAPWQPAVPDDHPFAADLDIFGHASLVQVIGPVRTPTGRRSLAEWLLHGGASPLEAIHDRQAAVRELVPALDFRQQLSALARLLPEATGSGGDHELPAAVHWAEARNGLGGRGWVSVMAVVLGVATVTGAIGAYIGVVTGSWWLLTGLLGWVLRWWVHEPLEHAVGGASGEHGLRPWAAVIGHVHAARFASPLLAAARADIDAAPAALRQLEQLVALSDVRHTAWLFVPLHTLTSWDLHVWWLIERWRQRHGADVRRWLEAVGRIDAAGGLAALAFDQPQWTFPLVDPTTGVIEGADVGHPLLADAVRVPNDVQLGPPGRFLLITGSNMSGKSTLLRAIGLNVVLAHAGGPTCTTAFRVPRLTLHTSMRVSDSLELGLSLFMASLVRLQQIVHAARIATADRRVCFLLDEVLQGTNSAERQIAVRTVVDHLLGCEAIGAVTTHDLELARDAGFTAHADSFHLQETLAGSGPTISMTFDYRLRPGPAQAGNALQLLRMLGLAE
ncbi:DNA mismatch repair protein MutS [Luteitalea pratensis]|uniref:DNA mismatch repair protein MutS n=2 Tax=Luteitalea pratensis TaxID=1855912 RepID=A0A143PIJ5_LUTPR|nr:DNA mismatch repair protein MutS [Luteitalea pratensis]